MYVYRVLNTCVINNFIHNAEDIIKSKIPLNNVNLILSEGPNSKIVDEDISKVSIPNKETSKAKKKVESIQ